MLRSYSRNTGSTSLESETSAAGCSSREDLGGAALVRGVGVAVQEHDGDRGDALGGDRARGGAHRRLVERLELVAVVVDAPGDLEDLLGRHRPLRLDPGEQAGRARDVLAADLQHVLKPVGDQQRRRAALALEDQVGRDRRAVQHARDVVAGEAACDRKTVRDAVARSLRDGSCGVDGVLAVRMTPVARGRAS